MTERLADLIFTEAAELVLVVGAVTWVLMLWGWVLFGGKK